MSIRSFISEFQDHLFNLEPLFNRLDIKRASKTDIFGAHKNAEEILDAFKQEVGFVETEALTIDSEVKEILASLNNKLDKLETFSSTIIGINSSQDSFKELLTIHPYILSNSVNWETIQKCILLPILSSYRTIKPYGEVLKSGKGVSRFLIDDAFSTKYITIQKLATTQLVSISYLNDDKDILSSTSLPNTINKIEVILEIPVNTKYILIDFYYETPQGLTITPLSFKHQPFDIVPLGKQTYDYGDILVFNSVVDLPTGCYAILDLNLSFLDVNNKEVLNKQVKLSLDSDGVLVKEASDKQVNDLVNGYWLNNIYTEDIISIPSDAHIVYRNKSQGEVSLFTESALKFKVKNAKHIVVTASLQLYSFKNKTQTPRVFSLTGMTKNV